MGQLSLLTAVVGLAALVLPGAGKYLAIGLGIVAIGTGFLGWRRQLHSPRARLSGAIGLALGVVALFLGAAKLGLTLVALDRLSRLFGD